MSPTPVSFFALPGIPLVEPGDDLAAILAKALSESEVGLRNGDALVVAQKIVSKAEGRYVNLDNIKPSERAVEIARRTGKDARRVEAIISESDEIVKLGPQLVIAAHKLGFVMANAGIDESNISHDDGTERILLLPRNPDGSAAELKRRLDATFGVSVAVIINDSFGRPWRNGVVGVALGAAGFPSLVDKRGAPDLFGRKLRVTEIAVADELASAASLLMGQAAEAFPAVLARGLRFEALARPAAALVREREKDLFR
jgi:coenzyme F420-0:L-glutamate ligase / coenzyme F420-1:gamma-L-glutamate ligase